MAPDCPFTSSSAPTRKCRMCSTGNGTYGRTRSSVDERGREVAAVRVEQASEQPVRAPIFKPVPRPVAGEPQLDIAELVEHRCAVEQRATVDWIPVTRCDGG